jgi:hypothetical protein
VFSAPNSVNGFQSKFYFSLSRIFMLPFFIVQEKVFQAAAVPAVLITIAVSLR